MSSGEGSCDCVERDRHNLKSDYLTYCNPSCCPLDNRWPLADRLLHLFTELRIPVFIDDYNYNIGSIDIANQLREAYKIYRATRHN